MGFLILLYTFAKSPNAKKIPCFFIFYNVHDIKQHALNFRNNNTISSSFDHRWLFFTTTLTKTDVNIMSCHLIRVRQVNHCLVPFSLRPLIFFLVVWGSYMHQASMVKSILHLRGTEKDKLPAINFFLKIRK